MGASIQDQRSARAPQFVPFVTWSGVLGHVRAGGEVYYWAPLDYLPARVSCHAFKNGKIKVYPPAGSGADAFTADSAHLDRFYFRRQSGAVEV